MAVEKINAFGVNKYKSLSFKGETNPAPEQPKEENKKLSEAAKWMIGATAVAASTIAGIAIYRHFNPSAAKKAVQQGAENLQQKAEEAAETLQQKAEAAAETLSQKAEDTAASVQEKLNIKPQTTEEAAEQAAETVASKTEQAAENVQPAAEETVHNITDKTEQVVQKADDTAEQTVQAAETAAEKLQPKIKPDEVSEEAKAKGREIYAKVDKELHRPPVKLNAEKLEELIVPKAKQDAWDMADMKAHFTNLEELSNQLPKIEESIDKLKQSGREEVFGLFERVKNGEEISVEELNKFADELQQKMTKQFAEAEYKKELREKIMSDSNLSRTLIDIETGFPESINKLAESVKNLPVLIKAKQQGIDKAPEAVAKFEEMLNKAAELDKLGNKEEAAQILQELQKHNISDMAEDYAHYLAAFDERNICTGHGMYDLTLLNLGKYRTLRNKADELVERFRKLVAQDETYLNAIKNKSKPAENPLKQASSQDAITKQQDDLLTMAAVDNFYTTGLHTEAPHAKINKTADEITGNITGQNTGLDTSFDNMMRKSIDNNKYNSGMDDMMAHKSSSNDMKSHYDDAMDMMAHKSPNDMKSHYDDAMDMMAHKSPNDMTSHYDDAMDMTAHKNPNDMTSHYDDAMDVSVDSFDDIMRNPIDNDFNNGVDDLLAHNSFDDMTSHYDGGIDISVDNFDDFGGF